MDGYTIGLLIKTLLASAGLKATLGIVFVGGFFFAAVKVAKAAAGFFQGLLDKRDAMLAATMERIASSDERRAEYERETSAILATIRADTASQLTEARATRTEMHQRFNKIQEDVTTIKGAVG